MSKKPNDPTDTSFDVIVIGSGFGGSVSALRMAEKGYRVLVIEKGKRFHPDDFPKTNWNIRKYLWMPRLKLYGIQCLTLLKHVFILHGSGVGGGSLVYANQLLVPPDDVFEKNEWGEGNWKDKLAPFYHRAKKVLGATPCPKVSDIDRYLGDVGKDVSGRDSFHINDVGVYFGEPDKVTPDPYFHGKGPNRVGCSFCGACMIGCPTGAKNTLDRNYLYLAEELGVTVIPETEVIGIQQTTSGYQLKARQSTGFRHRKKTYTAKKVILSGGVMGTVKLLLQCKRNGSLSDLSDQLGRYVRTNSEAILAVTSRQKDNDWNEQIAINSGIYPDNDTQIEVVRYNKGSDLLYFLSTLLTDGGKIPRQVTFLINLLRKPLSFFKSVWAFGASARSFVLLVMQTNENYMDMTYQRRWWRLGGKSVNTRIPDGQVKPPAYIPIANEVAKRMARKVDGFPKSSWTEVLFNVPTTAHILGGCRMGETRAEGVVDFNGQVFGYPDLYVADGSVVPANLGVNPSLTITALSEYIMDQMPDIKS